MNLAAVLGQFGGLAREALTTNFWGLGCPPHCHPSSISSLAACYLSGLLTGLLISLAALLWLLVHPDHPSAPSRIRVSVQQSAVSLRRRLEGYRPSLHE